MNVDVTTACGRVTGVMQDGIAVFRGIPYAAAPVGAARFAAPRPPEKWDGARDCRSFGPISPQAPPPGDYAPIFAPRLPQGEDSLNLNVWTPDLGATGLPVLVWIHGGGYMIGAGSESYYDGSSFARDGVVCVTINYRLGPAGFLCVGEGENGSFGQLDMIAALRWVQENIAAFGGDPARVTAAGESAGGMAIGTLLGTPAARGLFSRAIAQSGAAHHGLDLETARMVARECCARAGVSPDDLEGLRSVPWRRFAEIQAEINDDIAATQDESRYGPEIVSTGMPWQPVIGAGLVPRRPIEAIADGEAAGIDLLIGYTAEEDRLFFGIERPAITMDVVRAVYGATFGERGAEAFATYARRRHDPDDPLEMLAAIETDRMFRIPALRCAAAHAAHHRRTFLYQMSWPSPAFDGRIGAAHATDLPFMWHNLGDLLCQQLVGDTAPVSLADEMHGAWVTFVTDGVPRHPTLPEWPAYDASSRSLMDFDVPSTVRCAHPTDETELWDGLR